MTNRGTATIIRYPTPKSLLDAFNNHEDMLDAVVHDAPVLRYWVNTVGFSMSHLVGDVFAAQSYGIAFPFGSTLHPQVDLKLIALQESGEYNSLHQKWFTNANGEEEVTLDGTLYVPVIANIIVWTAVGICILASIVILFLSKSRSSRNRVRSIDKVALNSLIKNQSKSISVSDGQIGEPSGIELVQNSGVDELSREVKTLERNLSMMGDTMTRMMQDLKNTITTAQSQNYQI